MTAPAPPGRVTAAADDPPRARPGRGRVAAFVMLCLVAAGVATGYAVAAARSRPAASAGEPTATTDAAPAAVTAAPHVLFRSATGDAAAGRLAAAALEGDAGRPRALTDLACERVHADGGRGVCLRADRGLVTRYEAVVFGADFAPISVHPLPGSPSRVRVSPDGRRAATTVFVTGHSYAQGGFSTATTFLDLEQGTVLGNLEDFEVTRDGVPVTAVDRNYWGVTFAADGDRFFATLATRGRTFLVEGSVDGRTARVEHDDVECPSLSPDGTRIAYKHREQDAGGAVRWRVHVLRLADGRDVATAEARNVDDQVEWLDDERLLYAVPASEGIGTDVWTVAADGRSAPQLYLRGAESPAVQRTAAPTT